MKKDKRKVTPQPPAVPLHHKNVIQSPWTFRAFVHPPRKCEIQEKYDGETDELRASFEVAVSYLRVQRRQAWCRPAAAKLVKQKKFRDFYELRFKADNIQQRPIGYFGPGPNDFTILIWATEKGSLKPESWHGTAMDRMNQIKGGTAHAQEIKLAGKDKTP